MKVELTQEQVLVLKNHLFCIEYLKGTYQYDILKSIIERLEYASNDQLNINYKPILKHCPKCGVPLNQWKGHRFFKCCPMCEIRLDWSNQQ